MSEVGVSQSVADSLLMRPTTDDWESPLPDDEEWFIPLWLDILDLLAPSAYFRYLEIHQDNITYENDSDDGRACGEARIHLTGSYLDRFREIAANKLRQLTAGSAVTGVTGAVLVGGGIGLVIAATTTAIGVATAGVGAAVIAVGGIFIFTAVGVGVHIHRQKGKQEKE